MAAGAPRAWEGMQSMLHAAGEGAARVESLWWLMLVLFALVWALVVAASVLALRRRGAAADAGTERRARQAVVGASLATVLILLVVFGFNLYVGHGIAAVAAQATRQVELRGHQWWWEVRYLDEAPARIFTSANELHLPAGEAVQLRLESADVIHSFWAPSLGGKVDLIPGRRNTVTLRALAPGVYRAQCAEFCGLQHAWMALMVVVHPREEYARWLDEQLADPPPPADEAARAGQRVFMRHCSACHAVRGTPAGGRMGPDLTHVASRLTIGAGTLPNTEGHRAGWVANPQAIKPGNKMPYIPLEPEELRGVLHYLKGLR